MMRQILTVLALALNVAAASAAPVINTIAGSAPHGAATDWGIVPYDAVTDAAGNTYVSLGSDHRVIKISPAGQISNYAGNGIGTYSGDGIAAATASLNSPQGLALDAAGNLYIADSGNHRIRRVAAGTGIITTVAGSYYAGYAGDGGPATSAQLYYPSGVAVDAAGTVLYIADQSNNRIRRAVIGGNISTVAGGSTMPATGVSATGWALYSPIAVAVDTAGNAYIAVNSDRVILKLDTGGQISVVAGNGSSGTSGDGGAATSASFVSPRGLAVDGSTYLYVADSGAHRVRRVNLTTGTITAFAGNGSAAFAGDGGLATSASLYSPSDVAVDSAGNVYIADTSNQRVRVVNTSGIISTVAGTGTSGYSGDGGPATAAALASPQSVAVSGDGKLYIADYSNCRIRRVEGGTITTAIGYGTCSSTVSDGTAPGSTPIYYPLAVEVDSAGNVLYSDFYRVRRLTLSTGTVSTLAGSNSGGNGYNGDGSPANGRTLYSPYGIAVDASGAVYIADYQNYRVRKVVGTTISTVAGNGSCCTGGDGGSATSAKVYSPAQVALDTAGNLFVAEQSSHRIRRIDGSGVITTYAGNGTAGSAGDGGSASAAQLWSPRGVSVDAGGNLFIADYGNSRVRRVDVATGIITTLAGSGTAGYSGDGGAATSAQLRGPYSARISPAGSLVISDLGNYRVRSVTSGIISTLGGNGWASFSGDGGLATDAQLNIAAGVVVDPAGNVYFSDQSNQRVRRIDALTGTVTTVAGNGTVGYNGDNMAATSARLYYPAGLALDSDGNLYIADQYNNRIRKVDPDGVITTVAGNGCSSYNGDGIPATSACIYQPQDVAVDTANNLYIADYYNNRIRKVAGGIISTVAGTGSAGYNGDNMPATSATVGYPNGVDVDHEGNLYISENYNHRIRKVSGGTITTIVGNNPCSAYDNVPAASACLFSPRAVAVDAGGNVFFTSYYSRVQRIDATTGYVNTVAGNGAYGFSGDGGPALSAALAQSPGIFVQGDALYIADGVNDRIRKVTGILDSSGPSIVPSVSGTLGSNGWYRSNVNLSWTVTDPDSTVQTTSGCGSSTVTTDTTSVTFTCSATSAGGTSTQSVTIKRDVTKPVAAVASRLPAANAYGWNNADVTVQFSGTDATSGIASCTAPAIVSTQAANQSVTGSCTDYAGNVSNPVTQASISVDKTAPTASAAASPTANGSGWNKTAVTVTYSGTDALSGIASCDAPTTLGTEGTALGATGYCTDKAGNVSAPASVVGINIDLTKPVATATRTPGPNGYGWNNTSVTVSFTAIDAGSGIASCSAPVTLAVEGSALQASGTCVDVAGNVSDPVVASGINIDKTAPSVSAAATPVPGASGWNTSPVTVTFTGNDPLSGVVAGDCDAPVTLSSDGNGQSASGGCTDRAGNHASTTLGGIKIDQTPPTASAQASPPANAAGWNNSNVTVSFSGTDALPGSGMGPCSAPVVLSGEGTGQGASGYCSDVAGNTSATASVSNINIDKTPPVASASATPAANSNGWRNSDVSVAFSGTDALSGFVGCSPPVTLSTEGAAQSASGACTDAADNSSTVVAGGINIDKTPPTVTSSNAPAANAYGWNNGPVTVSFAASDALAGVDVASCTPDTMLNAEGANQTTTGACADLAGNVAAPVTSAPVSIDRTPPTVTAQSAPVPNANGWNQSDVTVSFGGTDNLSGIDSSSCSAPVSFTAEGTGYTATGSCTDKAGNPGANVTSAPVSIDKTPPIVSGNAAPTPNANGWNNTAVTVTFTATDAGGSGVPLGGCDSVVLSADGTGQSTTGSCVDRAGNSGSAIVSGVNIDRTAPVATASATPAPNANGWNNTDVTVSFSGTDAMNGSGLDSCTGPTTFTAEGTGYSASGSCSDKAGNTSAAASKTGIRIDKTAPVVTITTPSNGATYATGSTVNASYGCTDALAGVGSCAGPVATGSPIATGTNGSNNFTVNATDQAGNSAARTNTYSVAPGYTFIGFLSPVDNLPVLNAATAGRVIPVKWQLRDGSGAYVSSLSTFISMLQQPIACDAAPEDIVEEQLTTPGSTVLRYDSTSNQFIYNWQTTKGWTGCRLLQLTLSDGSKQYAKFKFK